MPLPAGTQFITGTCASDADCASSCCGFTTGKCAGAIIAQERDGGCGFGDANPNANAAKASGSQPAAPTDAEPAVHAKQATSANTNAGASAAADKQFITGTCAADADCASGCCAFNTGKCAGPVIAQQRNGGCGFGDGAPNADAAEALGSQVKAPGVQGRSFVA